MANKTSFSPVVTSWLSKFQPKRPTNLLTSKPLSFSSLIAIGLQGIAKGNSSSAAIPPFQLSNPTTPLTISSVQPATPEYLDTGTGSTTGSTDSPVTDPSVTAQLPNVATNVGMTASGFRTKKSSRKMLRSGAQGYGSMKISTNTPFASTINLG